MGVLHKGNWPERENRLVGVEGKVLSRLNQRGGGEWPEQPEKPNYPARTRAITARDDVRVSRDVGEKGCPRWWGLEAGEAIGGRFWELSCDPTQVPDQLWLSDFTGWGASAPLRPLVFPRRNLRS